MNSMRIAVVACMALFVSARISAQTSALDIPRTVSYQGLITKADGSAINGVQPITVQLFGDANGKQLLWEDSFSADIHNGVFDLQLGSRKPLPDATAWHGATWIAVKVGESASSGLSMLTASPYAMTVANNSITADKMATDYVGSVAINGEKITGKGGQINFVGADGLSLDYDKAANAVVVRGSGSSSPANNKGANIQTVDLDVKGNAYLEHNTTMGTTSSDSIFFNARAASALDMNSHNLNNVATANIATAAVSGNATVGGTFDVTGNTTLGGTLGVSGATTTNGITNTGSISSGTVTTSGNITDGGSLSVAGSSSTNGISNAGSISSGTVTTSGNITDGGSLSVAGSSSTNGITNTGSISSGTVTTSGDMTDGGILSVAGTSTLGGAVTVSGLLTLNGLTHLPLPLSGILAIDASNHVGYRTPAEIFSTAANNWILNQTTQQPAANFNISGSGVIGTTLSVGGNTTVGGNVSITGSHTLSVGGNTSIGGSLDMSNNQIHNLATPTAASDADTKGYTDNLNATQTASLNNEVARAQAAETTLQNNINAEATARTSADNTLQSNINSNDAAAVHKAGTEIITGNKTFTNGISVTAGGASIQGASGINTTSASTTDIGNLTNGQNIVLRANPISGIYAQFGSSDVGGVNVPGFNIENNAMNTGGASQPKRGATIRLANAYSGNAVGLLFDVSGGSVGNYDVWGTNNLWTVTNTGAITAASFTGNGSGLTNLTGANVVGDINGNAASINGSIAESQVTNLSGDLTTLQTNINNEANARQTADNTLQSNINAEATARQAADNALQNSINTNDASALHKAGAETVTGSKTFSPDQYFSSRIGVGNSSPAYPLDVTGDINSSTLYRLGTRAILQVAGGVSAGEPNIFMGSTVGNIDGYANMGLGWSDLTNTTTGAYNTATGYNAMVDNTTGLGNSAYGAGALQHNNADGNTAVGYNALQSNTSGGGNVGIGQNTLTSNTTGGGNDATGKNALQNNSIGSRNNAYGSSALQSTTTGNDNTALGNSAGSATTTASANTFVGAISGLSNTTGAHNTFVGYNTGNSNTTQNSNSAFGDNADVAAGITNATAIGANAKVTQSNSVVLGSINGTNGATANANVGIGTTTPAYPLDVVGTIHASGPVQSSNGLVIDGSVSPHQIWSSGNITFLTPDNAGGASGFIDIHTGGIL